MSFLHDFKQFAIKGNVVDLAVGVIIGGAFGKIVDSLVKDIVMPVLGKLIAGIDFKHMYLNLSQEHYTTLADAEKAGAPIIKYGMFINTVIDFFIIAFVIFLAVKVIHRLRYQAEKEEAEKPTPTPEEIVLLREIRDALKK